MTTRRHFLQTTLVTAIVVPYATAQGDATVRGHDIVVYGGTSGGIVAAIQAAKSGRSVVLVSPTEYLGGLTTSGLGWTDLGRDTILGGLSREFYTRLYHHYANDDAWQWEKREQYGNRGQDEAPAHNPKTKIASTFEPSAATTVFHAMLEEHGINVVTARLDLKNGVVMDGKRIRAIRAEDGRVFPGKMFIDASYEGDLLPGAGVSFTTGRESNATYNETINGIQVGRGGNQLPDGIDPYIVAGDPSSGLLPGVNPDAGGENGDGDHRFQAYCFRMVLTSVPENRVTIEKPDGYDEKTYEILCRAIEAGQTKGFNRFSPMPNRKTDSNNTGGISNNPIGWNYGDDWNWTTLDHDERLALAKKHEHWQRGLLWTLANHPRVPESIHRWYLKWGLPRDEFTDNGHWPHQLYVREARRMVSDFVMTEHHCRRNEPVPESIGLAAYTMDSHNVQRIVHNGMVKNEGDVQARIPGPYPVSYRAIVPKQGECENLLVPWSLSASHIAFGSIRMEPVFMILAQSAAIAADLCIKDDHAVQSLEYEKLRPVLLAAGQALDVE